jgi:hypothetical protein
MERQDSNKPQLTWLAKVRSSDCGGSFAHEFIFRGDSHKSSRIKSLGSLASGSRPRYPSVSGRTDAMMEGTLAIYDKTDVAANNLGYPEARRDEII